MPSPCSCCKLFCIWICRRLGIYHQQNTIETNTNNDNVDDWHQLDSICSLFLLCLIMSSVLPFQWLAIVVVELHKQHDKVDVALLVVSGVLCLTPPLLLMVYTGILVRQMLQENVSVVPIDTTAAAVGGGDGAGGMQA